MRDPVKVLLKTFENFPFQIFYQGRFKRKLEKVTISSWLEYFMVHMMNAFVAAELK